MPARTDSDIRAETAAAWREHPTVELHATAPASSSTGATDKEISVDAAEGYVVIDTHGAARLDREQLATLRKRLDSAFQVIA